MLDGADFIMKKINVTVDLEDVDIESSLESVIEELKRMKSEFEPAYSGLYLDVKTYQLPYDDWTYAKVVLCGQREETDFEYETRLRKEKKYKNEKEEQEKKELARLKKIYEKSNK